MQVAFVVAVVLMAMSVAATDSAEKEPTLNQKFEKFQQDVQTFVDQVGEKAKVALHDLQHSEFSNKTRNWFTDNFEKLKSKWKDAFSNQGSD